MCFIVVLDGVAFRRGFVGVTQCQVPRGSENEKWNWAERFFHFLFLLLDVNDISDQSVFSYILH